MIIKCTNLIQEETKTSDDDNQDTNEMIMKNEQIDHQSRMYDHHHQHHPSDMINNGTRANASNSSETSECENRLYTCTDCGKSFQTSSGLKQHRNIHSSVKPWKCEFCTKSYTQFSNLCRHKRSHTNARTQIECKDCGQSFQSHVALNKHRSSCKERHVSTSMVTPNFAAALLPFIDTTSILNQSTKSEPSISSPNEPIDLTKTLKRSRQLSTDQPIDYSIYHKRNDFHHQHSSHVFGSDKQHEKKLKKDEHSPYHEQIQTDDGGDDDENDDEDLDDHQQYISYAKNSIKDYNDHRPLTPVSSSSSPQTISSLEKKPILSANDSSMTRNRDRYSCTYCSKTFPRSANLTRHLRTHTGEQPYVCKFCNRSFSISSNLQRHIRNIHKRERPFRCTHCEKCFGQQTNLDRHMKKHLSQTSSSSAAAATFLTQFERNATTSALQNAYLASMPISAMNLNRNLNENLRDNSTEDEDSSEFSSEDEEEDLEDEEEEEEDDLETNSLSIADTDEINHQQATSSST